MVCNNDHISVEMLFEVFPEITKPSILILSSVGS